MKDTLVIDGKTYRMEEQIDQYTDLNQEREKIKERLDKINEAYIKYGNMYSNTEKPQAREFWLVESAFKDGYISVFKNDPCCRSIHVREILKDQNSSPLRVIQPDELVITRERLGLAWDRCLKDVRNLVSPFEQNPTFNNLCKELGLSKK